MKVELKEISIRDVVANYVDNAEEGVIGYGGKLNIRPKYQREFVYDEKRRNAVIDTILKGFPLNIMYWVKNEDGTFEVLDGQQRTISFCRYVTGGFSVVVDGYPRTFDNLPTAVKERILNYKLMIYFCEGNDEEKLAWFKVVNTAGKPLNEQELRNAVYTGTWLTHAKSIFSKSNCAAYNLSKDYVNGSAIEQAILETALTWISKDNIEKYMSAHQHDPNANELWTYFRNIIEWVQGTFVKYRKEMKGLSWGELYDIYKDKMFDTAALEKEIAALMIDDEIQNKKGIYLYVLTRNNKYLNLRTFTESQKRQAYEKQKGVCKNCGKQFAFEQMQGDHIDPWSKGGKTIPENCQMLCAECNRRKSAI